MRLSEPAKDEKWFPDISELEAIFPYGTVDHSAERICQQVSRYTLLHWLLRISLYIIVLDFLYLEEL